MTYETAKKFYRARTISLLALFLLIIGTIHLDLDLSNKFYKSTILILLAIQVFSIVVYWIEYKCAQCKASIFSENINMLEYMQSPPEFCPRCRTRMPHD